MKIDPVELLDARLIALRHVVGIALSMATDNRAGNVQVLEALQTGLMSMPLTFKGAPEPSIDFQTLMRMEFEKTLDLAVEHRKLMNAPPKTETGQ